MAPLLAAEPSLGNLAGAGLDVFAAEPLPAGHPLFALPNVVLAPHVAWLTRETLNRSLDVDRTTIAEEESWAVELNHHTADVQEGIASFREKRDPRFRGW